jgi:hypothetical protein
MAEFIKRALNENKDFASMDYDKQKQLIKNYAVEKMRVTDASRKMKEAQKQTVLNEMNGQNNGQTANANVAK